MTFKILLELMFRPRKLKFLVFERNVQSDSKFLILYFFPKRLSGLEMSSNAILNFETLKVALFQKVQGNFFISQIAKIIIPFYYPKLLHPVHDIKKPIIYFDTFYV